MMKVGSFLAILLFLASAVGAGSTPGVGYDAFPGKPDPYATGAFDRDAFVARYGEGPEMQQYWPGFVAELFFFNALALRNACLAGALGDPAVYDCQPKIVEQLDLAKSVRRPGFIEFPGHPVHYDPDNFYCRWWKYEGTEPGDTPENPIEVADPERPAGPYSASPQTGWACPVYYLNAPPITGCVVDADTLCLNDGRYAVTVEWDTGSGIGPGHAVALTADTGAFWFFGPQNLELLVKVIPGCPLNQKVWVFVAGLTDVGIELQVTDVETSETRTYLSPRGRALQPIQDTSAFPCD